MPCAMLETLVIASNPWAVVCFALGIAALLFVFRRTIFRARSKTDPLAEMSARFNAAHKRVEQIAEREQHHKLQTGLRFFRGDIDIPDHDRQVLSNVSQMHARNRRNG